MNTKIYTQEAQKLSIISFISTLHVIDTWMFPTQFIMISFLSVKKRYEYYYLHYCKHIILNRYPIFRKFICQRDSLDSI